MELLTRGYDRPAEGKRMQRVLGVAMVVLFAVVIVEAIALRRIRVELAAARALAATSDLEMRGEELGRAGQWLHAWLQSPEGGNHAGGLCPSGSPDVDRIRQLLFATYLQARSAGVGEAEARGMVTAKARD